MTRHRLCNECYAATGHAAHCVSKGYAGVGPHPDAPPDTARAPVRGAPPAQCPCGIARADCEYHAVAERPSYEVYDWSKLGPIPAWAQTLEERAGPVEIVGHTLVPYGSADLHFTFAGQRIWETSAPSHWCNSPVCPTCRIAT